MVVVIVEVEVQGDENSFPDFKNTDVDTDDTLEIAEEAYYHGYSLSTLVPEVEFGYFVLAMVAKEFESSTLGGKYCRVCTVVM